MTNSLIVAFTGRDDAPTRDQYELCYLWMQKHRVQVGIHGACVGADNLFDEICNELGVPRELRPAIHATKSAIEACTLRRRSNFQVFPKKEPLKRNLDIVRRAQVLLAMPSTREEVLRSGTWATVRAFRKTHPNPEDVVFFYP